MHFGNGLHEQISVIPPALAKAIVPLSEDFEKAFSKKDGPGETLRGFQWHLQIWANQNEQLTQHWLEAEEGVLYSVSDFADLNVLLILANFPAPVKTHSCCQSRHLENFLRRLLSFIVMIN